MYVVVQRGSVSLIRKSVHISGHVWSVCIPIPTTRTIIKYFHNLFLQAQYIQNGGRCGPCGDNYADPQPRSNENTGTYGNGVISGVYSAGSVIDVTSVLTANHLGTITYSLCSLDDPNLPESDSCFQDLKLADGSAAYSVASNDYKVINQVQLPAGLTCERCVLRWHYKTGNSWGVCEDGTGALGCGNQEVFRSCADIFIA
ncbi:hypothetical protein NQ314_013114 [Rhamnusium bicolor]|uniref:Chitin-binding type-4 domain-containing protein n=1 Tax=Rhamnusium bicolor TaxID=1586634 RepID=A0AAV8X7W9_9CUCU|nr:hypothetical protein NQ314_013114 [Rhamnusium bicolor]